MTARTAILEAYDNHSDCLQEAEDEYELCMEDQCYEDYC